MRIVLTFLVVAAFLTGCATRPTGLTSTAHAAAAAQKRGDWAAAVQLWQQAIKEEQGIWRQHEMARPSERLAIFYYELGRSQGVVGQFDAAEKNLFEALRLDERF